MRFLQNAARNVFFTGKGGVGKTSVACASAVRLAESGRRVLLVSTDPASNLDEVLGVSLGQQPTSVPGLSGLWGMNLNPEQAAADYRERVLGPYRGQLPPSVIQSMEEQLSGSCTLEIATFEQFARLLGDASSTQAFDHVLFDTAPTGHTLRLLALPSAWTGYLETNTTGTSCLGPLAGLKAQQQIYEAAVAALRDPDRTTLVLVTRPESGAVREAARTCAELATLGIPCSHLVVNGIFQAVDRADPVAGAMECQQRAVLAALPETLKDLPRTEIPLSAAGGVGLTALRSFGQAGPVPPGPIRDELPLTLPNLESLTEELARPGHGVILTMGKGGVGKTTVAAAIAVALADRGHRVLLTTTDPAAHVSAVLTETPDNLSLGRIDPAAETARYSATVLNETTAGLDAAGRALVEEDLRSPCTEEIAVFRAFADLVAQGGDQFVVLDTAPTGHTILLLDAALAYRHEVARQASQLPEAVVQLLPRLRDPEFTRVLIITLPEATPVHEAASLQQDLVRAGIQPHAWVINQCLLPLAVTDPILCARRTDQQRYVREVLTLSDRTAVVPWQSEPPVGPAALRHWSSSVPALRVQS